jgi:hypothetical protein
MSGPRIRVAALMEAPKQSLCQRFPVILFHCNGNIMQYLRLLSPPNITKMKNRLFI